MTDLLETVARAIAQNGFGRDWDDFLPINAHDTDQSDLLDYAVAAIRSLIDQPAPSFDLVADAAMVLPPGKWCACGLPHETGGPCWECRDRALASQKEGSHD